MEEKKVLIICYYWPPSGGAGVQRWLKLSKYLAESGMKVFVLTVDEQYASYLNQDKSLEKDIHPEVHVRKTKSFEPINLYARIFGNEKVPTAGFSNVDNTRFSQKLVNSIRSNFFIPDPRKGWKKYALSAALEIIKEQKINTIITTSPPHSTQLIGLALKKKLDIHWIVDLRDPWTDIYYYEILGHSPWSRKKDRKLEMEVLLNADHIITVSEGFKEIFLSKSKQITSQEVSVIPNGFDAEDFKETGIISTNEKFTICYTGTMSDQYEPQTFFEALKEVVERNQDCIMKFQLVGMASDSIKAGLSKLPLEFEMIPTVPHDEVLEYQKKADLLLLVIPRVNRSEGIVPGKVFEYLASKNPILSIGAKNSDVGLILKKCNAGRNFSWDDKDGMTQFVENTLAKFKNGEKPLVNKEAMMKYSREYQASQVSKLI